MAANLEKLKNIIRPSKLNVSNVFLSPEVGFKLLHNNIQKELKVTIIGARHLPNIFGFNPVHGYVIKVKIFPGIEKFETELRTESWPIYNQEFTFHLDTKSDPEQQISGNFLVLTAYAILENKGTPSVDENEDPIPENFARKYQRKLSNFFEKHNKTDQEKSPPTQVVQNKFENFMTFEKRRTIGSVTYSIQYSQFTKPASNFSKMTEEIWKNFENLSGVTTPIKTGVTQSIKPVAMKKGEIEIGLLYKKSEDGERCSFTFSLSRMRCSLQIMQQHEHLNGLLYIKLRILNRNQIVMKGKTDQFPPSISYKFNTNSSNIKATFPISELENIEFHLILMTKPKVGKKAELGKIVLACNSKGSYLIQWEKTIENPTKTITMWQPLLE